MKVPYNNATSILLNIKLHRVPRRVKENKHTTSLLALAITFMFLGHQTQIQISSKNQSTPSACVNSDHTSSLIAPEPLLLEECVNL